MTIILIAIWALLMLRSTYAEYQYYQAVKNLEPEIWAQLGSPRFLKIPMVFVSSKNAKLLAKITNKKVIELKNQHRKAGIHFLVYVVLVIGFSIIYFTFA
jgi:membrane protease YdiL (CAAX protease family)